MIPNKEQAINLLKENLKEKANLEHCFLVGFGMQGLANYFEEDKDYWFVVGLLHDLDLECFGGDINKHTLVAEKILQEKGIDKN
jgi:predicted hydrolase (HD superfamily)